MSRNVLHTKISTYPLDNRYDNLLRAIVKEDPLPLSSQINTLQQQERQFYNEILGLGAGKIKTYQEFITELRARVFAVKECFSRLSSYNKPEGLKQFFLDHVSLGSNFNRTDKQQSHFSTLKNKGLLPSNDINAFDIKQQLTFDVSALAQGKLEIIFYTRLENSSKKGEKKKRNQKKVNISETLRTILNNKELSSTMNFNDFENKIVTELVEMLSFSLKEKGDFLISVPQIVGALKKPIIDTLLNQQVSINNIILDASSANAIYEQAISRTTQESIITSKTKYSSPQGIIQLREIFLDYLTKGVMPGEYLTRFREAFNLAWDRYGADLVAGIQTPGASNFIGTLGELEVLTLLYFLNKQSSLIEWTGKERDSIYNELKRADVLFGYTGIQAKNFKDLNSPAAVKLHPLQLIERLIDSGFGEVQAGTLKELLANMGFNRDAFDQYESGLQDILEYYLGATLNLNLSITNQKQQNPLGYLEKDASNFWAVGGNIILPGSEILQCFAEALTKNQAKIDLKFPKNTQKTDEQFLNEANPSSKNFSPLFTKYWVRKKGNNWMSTNENTNEYSNLLSSRNISIIANFNFMKLFKENISNYTFYN